MKLSEKGLLRLRDEAVRIVENGTIAHLPIGSAQMEALSAFEFKPSDFEGAVALTIEEAKQVQQEFLDIVCEIVSVLGHYGVKYAKPASLIMLEERIEQAEEQ